MKIKLILSTLFLSALLLSGCGKKVVPPPTPAPNVGTTDTTDTVTTASIVSTEADFVKAIANDGTWIIAILNDLTTEKELVLEGSFENSRGEIQRKIALYEQDDKKNITQRYTLTAPKLTINSPMASLQHGVFNGDIEVLVSDFELVDTKVNGDIIFANDDVMASFKMDGDSAVSGEQKVK